MSFLKRNPKVKTVKRIRLDNARANGASTDHIRQFFSCLQHPVITGILACHRYNMDETRLMEGMGANGLVLGRAENNAKIARDSGSRTWVNIVECISADGKSIPPLVIFSNKTLQQQYFPDNLSKTTEYSGWFLFQMPDTGRSRLVSAESDGFFLYSKRGWGCKSTCDVVLLLWLGPGCRRNGPETQANPWSLVKSGPTCDQRPKAGRKPGLEHGKESAKSTS